jgi:hypothetical protein
VTGPLRSGLCDRAPAGTPSSTVTGLLWPGTLNRMTIEPRRTKKIVFQRPRLHQTFDENFSSNSDIDALDTSNVDSNPDRNIVLRFESDSSGDSSRSLPAGCEHVQCLVDALPADLTAEQRQHAIDFIISHSDQFSKSEYDLGRTRLVQHHIDTGDNHPFKEMLRRHPMAYLPVIDEHVQNMLDADVIEPAVSPWASNVTMVTKKDGSLRFCVDYRRLNAMTRKDSYPLPRVEDCLYSLGKAQFVSTLDLKAGYWQAEISEQDRDKTCFVTRKGTWRFKV